MKKMKLPRKNFQRKAAVALALAVSLWIADGGVASAGGNLYMDIQEDNVLTLDGGPIPDGAKVSPHFDASTKTMTITGGEWYDWNFYGGHALGASQDGRDFTTDISNLSGRLDVYGADVRRDAEASGNLVKGTNVDIEGNVYGCDTDNGSHGFNNTVLLTNSRINGRVYGGANLWPLAGLFYAKMENNTIILDNTEVTSAVIGGRGGEIYNNTITLNNATVGGAILGGFGGLSNSGHTLNLFGANTAGSVESFDTIKVQDAWTMPSQNGVDGPTFNLAWNDTAPLLSAGSFLNFGTLDIADASVLANHKKTGTMTLLQSGMAHNFAALTVKYPGGSVTFDNATTSKILTESARASETEKGVTLEGTARHSLLLADVNGKTKNAVQYDIQLFRIDGVSLGNMAWNDPRVIRAPGLVDFSAVNSIDATNLFFTNFNTDLAVGNPHDLLTNATNLRVGLAVTGASHSQDFDATAANGAKLSGTLAGTVSTAADTVQFTPSNITLNSIELAGWDGTKDAVNIPASWTGKNIPVATDGIDVPDELMAGATKTILTANEGTFSDDAITGENTYRFVSGSHTRNGVTFTGEGWRGVWSQNQGKDLVFSSGDLNISNVAFGKVPFTAGGTLRNLSNIHVHYDDATMDFSEFSIANPTDAGKNESMTLLKGNDTLADMAAQTKVQPYIARPVQGLLVGATLAGTVSIAGGNAVYHATENSAQHIAFDNVAWRNGGTLFDHGTSLTKVDFDGAAVNTNHITFSPSINISTGETMTLIKNYGGAPGSIATGVYNIGSVLQGDGDASMNGGDLIFNIKGLPDRAQPQTHHALMAGLAGMATLSAGNDSIGSAAEGLGLASNTGADGVSTYARMGGGSMRQETGSHVDVHTWNALLALGHKNEREKFSFEYGAFFEYGTGNYSTFDDGNRGDGGLHYTGGGLLAKYARTNGAYVEGSLRAGSVHNDARNLLRDGLGNPYSFETDTPYWGFHLGVGREIELAGGNTLDVYGKFFMNRRNAISFDAGGHYDLDAVTSSVLRVGARYTLKRNTWDFYGGLAYEHELDGKATGRVTAGAYGADIRSADVSGGSVRMELGATMKPENSPWSLDLNVTGFAGKKRGFSGGVSVAFMF